MRARAAIAVLAVTTLFVSSRLILVGISHEPPAAPRAPDAKRALRAPEPIEPRPPPPSPAPTATRWAEPEPPSKPVLRCETTLGPFEIEIDPELCPNSATQLTKLAQSGFLSQGLAFWRVNKWITQFGADQSPEGRKKTGRDDPFTAVRKGNKADRHPACPPLGDLTVEESPCTSEAEKAARSSAGWPRGTLAVIGSTALLVVRSGNNNMGTAPHDCPLGHVLGDGMVDVFDKLHDSYGNHIDTNSGISQRDIFKEGLDLVYREFPKLDLLQKCTLE